MATKTSGSPPKSDSGEGHPNDSHSDALNPANKTWQPEGWNEDYPGDNIARPGKSPEGWDEDNSGYDENDPSSKSKKPDAASDSSVANQEAAAGDGSNGDTTSLNEPEQSLVREAAPKGKKASGMLSNVGGSAKTKIILGITVFIVIAMGGAAFLLPAFFLKTITQQVVEAFFDRANYAIEQRAERIVGKYVTEVVGGTLRQCPGKISKDCAAVDPDNDSLYSTLVTSWRNNRMETRLFEKHGIEFRLDPKNSTKIQVFKRGVPLRGDGDFGRREVIREVKKAINAESKFDGILTRRHIRSVLASKYGARSWCLIACDKLDALDERKLKGIQKIKLRMVAKVSEFGSGRTTGYLLCKVASCNLSELKSSDNSIIQEILARSDESKIKGILDDLDYHKTNSFTQLILKKFITKILAKIVSESAAKAVASAVPYAGQVYAAANIVELYTQLDEAIDNNEISEFMRGVNEQEAALFASQIQVMAEDTQSFESSVSDSWAAFEYLNGAGKSRIYQKINGKSKLPTKQCDDGVVLNPDDTELTCPKFKVQPELKIEEIRDHPVISTLSEVTNTYKCSVREPVTDKCLLSPRFIIRPALEIVNRILGFIGEKFMNLLRIIPFLDTLATLFEGWAEQLFGWVSEKVMVRVTNMDAEDDVAYDQYVMGTAVTAKQFEKGDYEKTEASSLESSLMSDKQAYELDLKIAEKKKEEAKSKSFFARYFDINDSESLLAKSTINTAMIMVGGQETIMEQVNPVNTLDTIAFSLGLNKPARALTSINTMDAFGVQQYARAVDSADYEIDPSSLTPEKCEEYKQLRLATKIPADISETGEDEFTVSNPCALDEVIVDSFTKLDDLDDSQSSDDPAETGPSTINYPGLTGPSIPCNPTPRAVVRTTGGNGSPRADWAGIPTVGSIGTTTDGMPINVYVREACPGATDIKTIFIASSIHGSENGGQLVAHELLFNTDLPDYIRIIVVPEINSAGILSRSFRPRVNMNGVNLNRNFDYRWSDGTSTQDNWNYRGTAPESEPETQALVSFMEALGDQVDIGIHYHDIDTIPYVAAAIMGSSTEFAIMYQNISSTTPLRAAEGGTVSQGGSFDGWQKSALGIDALLVEMSQDQSEGVIQEHVNAVKAIAESGRL